DYPAHLHSRIRVAAFLKPLSEYIAAADAVVARAGATTIAEIGSQKKPLIIVPNPYLSGGHQLKNAQIYEDKKAAIVIGEHQALKDPKLLSDAINRVISSPDEAENMAGRLYGMVQKDSADKISELLVRVARKRRRDT
ncbi:MAG TPA: glycosyltransferase, partial [Candidatus Saccharimonadales bacterium]|nr:glycosyltransferase [Candidatus Saccharimonadales bacterium]